MHAKVTFIKEAEISKEKTVLHVAEDLKLKIKASCDGKAKCGKCVIRSASGAVSEPSKAEVKLLGDKKIAEGYRLACETKILGDAEIRLIDKE